DEPAWGKNSASFYYALSTGDYAATYQLAHPGVTTMWAGAAAYHLQFPQYQRVGQVQLGDTRLFQIFEKHGPPPMEVLATARMFVALLVILTLLVSFYFARRLFGLLPALAGLGLMALDPFFVGHSRLLHVDALLSSFMFLSLIAYLHFQRFRRWPALVVSGAAGGLSLLTKTPGMLLFPVIGLLAGLDLLRAYLREGSLRRASHWGQAALPLAWWAALAGFVFFLAWPAMWVEPGTTLSRMADYTLSSAEGEIGGAQFVEAFEAGGGRGSMYLYFYPLTIAWRSTPQVLIGLLLLPFLLLDKSNRVTSQAGGAAFLGLGVFLAVFTLFMSLGTKKFDRYFLPAYPPLQLLAGVGWISAVDWFQASRTGLTRKLPSLLVASLLLGGQLLLLRQHFPYYLTYYNPLMGGSRKAEEVMMIGWGEGLNQAAVYLRSIPDIRNRTILSWYSLAFNWYSLSFRFEAEPIPFPGDLRGSQGVNLQAADYLVLYANQWQRRIPGELFDLLAGQEPEKTIWIDGIEYARIYHLEH
ncbi:MAG TPA: phospholipid carrier-dependent glycosyltransferase, partial [Anaerolineales bacterium]|nr:phospholipid carrier-dependent glycosyltransferase [Anaerolineales bacterium]